MGRMQWPCAWAAAWGRPADPGRQGGAGRHGGRGLFRQQWRPSNLNPATFKPPSWTTSPPPPQLALHIYSLKKLHINLSLHSSFISTPHYSTCLVICPAVQCPETRELAWPFHGAPAPRRFFATPCNTTHITALHANLPHVAPCCTHKHCSTTHAKNASCKCAAKCQPHHIASRATHSHAQYHTWRENSKCIIHKHLQRQASLSLKHTHAPHHVGKDRTSTEVQQQFLPHHPQSCDSSPH